jgi:hypothetical protein
MMELSVERLTEIAECVPWETFEKIEDGSLMLEDPKREAAQDDEFADYRYTYYLRVGLHLRQPTQAIICRGNYIRMRHGKRWEGFISHLRKLDCKTPEMLLYYFPMYADVSGLNAYSTSASVAYWNPMLAYAQQQAQAMGANQMQNAHKQNAHNQMTLAQANQAYNNKYSTIVGHQSGLVGAAPMPTVGQSQPSLLAQVRKLLP